MTTGFDTSEASAIRLDQSDPLPSCRDQFHIPPDAGAGESVYLCGNSLGLQPRGVRDALLETLDDWARLGVEAHLHARSPWVPYHEFLRETGARLVGAKPGEVVMMNSLTVNLHLMMASFYRPAGRKTRILVDDPIFPSDSHALLSQARWHGLDPAAAILRQRPRSAEHTLRTDDVIATIREHKEDLALVLLAGVNYLTGQAMNMGAITAAAHESGVTIGWDLAHAAGNIELDLHACGGVGADFAVWCSYKYLNAGPGAVAGCFVHERHAHRPDLPRLAGWWGNDPATRFAMKPEFIPKDGADGWQLSNPPILAAVPLRVSLDLFDRIGMTPLRAKSQRLTAYLLAQIDALGPSTVEVITPRDPQQRGCQLSLAVQHRARDLHAALQRDAVVCDFREPNVIRVAPTPLYNTFHDCWRFARVLARHTQG